MNDQIVFLFCIKNVNHIAMGIFQIALITYLSASFRIKRRNIEHQLVHIAFFLGAHFAISGNFHIGFEHIVPYKFGFGIFFYNYPIIGIHFTGRSRTLFLLLEFFIKPLFVQFQSFFWKNQPG